MVLLKLNYIKMIQLKDKEHREASKKKPYVEKREPKLRSDFPELEFVTSEEIAVANKIREEIKFFKAAALRYLHEEEYLTIDKVERIVNDPVYRKKNPLTPELNWDYAAIRLLHFLQTKEFFHKDEKGIKQVKLADLQEDMDALRKEFPKLVEDLENSGVEDDLNLNVCELMNAKDENQVEINKTLEKSFHMSRFQSFVMKFSTWISSKLDWPELDMEDQMASEITSLMGKDNRIGILMKRYIVALRCMRIVDNIQIDYTKNRYK